MKRVKKKKKKKTKKTTLKVETLKTLLGILLASDMVQGWGIWSEKEEREK